MTKPVRRRPSPYATAFQRLGEVGEALAMLMVVETRSDETIRIGNLVEARDRLSIAIDRVARGHE